jgi:alpha-L-rhamnosidase
MKKSALYSSFDITGLLQKWRKCCRHHAWVTAGTPRIGRVRRELKTGSKFIGSAVPKVILQLEIQLDDGSHLKLVTDETWKIARGPIVRNDIYDGEIYDARLEKSGWDNFGYDDSQWEKAGLFQPPGGQLVSQGTCPPIKKIKTTQPVIMSNPGSNVFVYDFGQNFTGWVKLTVSGPRGTEVKLRFSELLHSDGMINVIPNRTAKVTDSYILKGRRG